MKPAEFPPVHRLFEMQAAATAQAPAIRFKDQTVSYDELNLRANGLAHRLIREGVRRGDLVGISVERGPEMIVGLLGILKAGAAYVPFDPEYPPARLRLMIGEIENSPIVTCGRAAQYLENLGSPLRLVPVEDTTHPSAAETFQNPDDSATGDDSVYVMYTSGSTGRPKGVIARHAGVVRLVRDTHYCRFGPDEVFLHLSPLSFDASTFEIWGALLNGGCLAVVPSGTPSLLALEAVIRRHSVTTAFLTTSLFHLVVDKQAEALAPLRQVVVGGEVISPRHVRKALDFMTDGVVVNGYGPTETTTFACALRMNADYQPGKTVPIGRAIVNTTVHVLDEHLRLVPPGTAGELYIGGPGVAKGYLNNESLTAEKFLPDPFSCDPEARLYRTGDRVCELPDENLEFLGRCDDQVKIMGHRIEPGEVESVLLEQHAVGQASVIARSDSRGEKYLVAYVVPSQPGRFSADELRRDLAQFLPCFMIPARVIQMEALPLRPNGKVDRSALPEPDSFLAPANVTPNSTQPDLEQRLIAIWAQILQCRVGRDSNFFDLGGTSLKLIEVHAEVCKTLGREVALNDLFEYATVRRLAAHLEGPQRQVETLRSQTEARARLQRSAFASRRLVVEAG